jgi:hypothetical protein
VKCATGGCGANPTTLAATQASSFIAVDGTSVYWTTYGADGGTVMKCATAGCAGNGSTLASSRG